MCSDSLNISERARWVACLLGRTRGHGRQDIIPSGRRIDNNTFDVLEAMAMPPVQGPARHGREDIIKRLSLVPRAAAGVLCPLGGAPEGTPRRPRGPETQSSSVSLA